MSEQQDLLAGMLLQAIATLGDALERLDKVEHAVLDLKADRTRHERAIARLASMR